MNKVAAILIITSLMLAGCQETTTSSSIETAISAPVESIIVPPSEAVQPEMTAAPKEVATKEVDTAAVSKLIPQGMTISQISSGEDAVIKGDLNKDGIPDVALIVEDITDSSKDRDLLIAFGTQDGTYEQSIYAKQAILCKDCGGVFGDPLDNLTLSNGSVLLSLYGGSSDRWYYKDRFQYRDNDWYWIGETSGHYSTNDLTSGTEIDVNLITGDYIEKQSNKKGTLIETKRGKREKKNLIKLMDYNHFATLR